MFQGAVCSSGSGDSQTRRALPKLSGFSDAQLARGGAERSGGSVSRGASCPLPPRGVPLAVLHSRRGFPSSPQSQCRHLQGLQITGSGGFSSGISEFLLFSPGEHQNLSKRIQPRFAVFKGINKSRTRIRRPATCAAIL